jgi:hypothetical protein
MKKTEAPNKPLAVLKPAQILLLLFEVNVIGDEEHKGSVNASHRDISCTRSTGHTGKNGHAQRAAHREAVFRTVFHRIFDAWHNKVLWTCALTRLL